jgi:hypothetical protein
LDGRLEDGKYMPHNRAGRKRGRTTGQCLSIYLLYFAKVNEQNPDGKRREVCNYNAYTEMMHLTVPEGVSKEMG